VAPHSVYSHRFGGREFRFANAEVGHVHDGGIVDIHFRVPSRRALKRKGLLKSISGFPIQGGLHFAFETAMIYSTRYGSCVLSYFRYALKAAADPASFCGGESRTATERSVQVSSRTIRAFNQVANTKIWHAREGVPATRRVAW